MAVLRDTRRAGWPYRKTVTLHGTQERKRSRARPSSTRGWRPRTRRGSTSSACSPRLPRRSRSSQKEVPTFGEFAEGVHRDLPRANNKPSRGAEAETILRTICFRRWREALDASAAGDRGATRATSSRRRSLEDDQQPPHHVAAPVSVATEWELIEKSRGEVAQGAGAGVRLPRLRGGGAALARGSGVGAA